MSSPDTEQPGLDGVVASVLVFLDSTVTVLRERGVEQTLEPTGAVEPPTTHGRTGEPGGFSLSVEKFCHFSYADMVTLLSIFPEEATVRLVCVNRKSVRLNRDGVEAKRGEAKNGIVVSNIRVIDGRSLEELRSALEDHKVRVLDDFCAEVSWSHHRAVLKFGPGQRKALLSVTSDGEERAVFWPVPVVRIAEFKSFLRLMVRAVIRIGVAVFLWFLAFGLLRTIPEYGSWNSYTGMWHGYIHLWQEFSHGINRPVGAAPIIPDGTVAAMTGVPLLAAASLLTLLTTKGSLKEAVRSRVVMAPFVPWNRLTASWRAATDPSTLRTTLSAGLEYLTARFPSLDASRTRNAIKVLGAFTFITLVTLLISGPAGVGVFLAWAAVVVGALKGIWHRQD